MTQDVDFVRFNHQKSAIPKHFHDTYCFSLIREGIEKIEFEERSVYIPKGYITILNPFEVHANPIVDVDCALSWDTIYLSEEIVSYFFKRPHLTFKHKQIFDGQIVMMFQRLADDFYSHRFLNEGLLGMFLKRVLKYCESEESIQPSPFKSEYIQNLTRYIENHIEDKLYLDELSKIACQNKYSFSRNFKLFTGMTPMHYVAMKKVFLAKNDIKTGCSIKEVSVNYNFTDISHFSKTFKKFVGISPLAYKSHLL